MAMLSLSSIATIIATLTIWTLALTAYYTRSLPPKQDPSDQ
jgi:hypothetical protein